MRVCLEAKTDQRAADISTSRGYHQTMRGGEKETGREGDEGGGREEEREKREGRGGVERWRRVREGVCVDPSLACIALG